MRAIVICQPYASAIFMDKNPKDVENRTWATHHVGGLAILAGKSLDWIDSLTVEQWGLIEPLQPVESLPRGVIIGLVDVDDVQPMSPALKSNPWAFGPYCWILSNPRKLVTPIPYCGRQGLFNLSDEITRKIENEMDKLFTEEILNRWSGYPS